jgi:pyruvate/2-oxoglutarate dehydrogenase complex dihydrolipoamide acyltransferase (E2) component
MFGIKPIMHLVLTYDHRVVDGMLAGRFLKSVRDRLEAFDFFR